MSWPIANASMGMHCTEHQTTFRVYAPRSERVDVLLYRSHLDVRRRVHPMEAVGDGSFVLELAGDWHGWFYLYLLDETVAVTDPHSVSLAINSTKSAVLDLRRSDPPGWATHNRPRTSWKDAVIYELHIKDYTGDVSSGVCYRGKYMGMVEAGTVWESVSTGLDHLTKLGVTHVHLMPVSDFITVQEDTDSFYDDDSYNWGYDPEHFNAPEGSYATDPENPETRVRELKHLIMALHERGIGVVLDVVYNHTYRATDSNFHALAPYYYHRTYADGTLSNGSGCGNEFASEQPMARRFLLESLHFWQTEYAVDGFRFDLMALIDKKTVEEIVRLTRATDPNVLLYGEPWAALPSALPLAQISGKGAQKGKEYAIFNDEFREALRGGNDDRSPGYVQGAWDRKSAVQEGILGSIPSVPTKFKTMEEAWESINYFNSHDNLIIADKLLLTHSQEESTMMTRWLFSVLLFSFGIPFFHAGNEFMRSKGGEHNSYRSPLSVNGIRWDKKKKHQSLVEYVRDAITLRKELGFFGRYSAEEIRKRVHFFNDLPPQVIGYRVEDPKKGEHWIYHNAGQVAYRVRLKQQNTERICRFDITGIQYRSHWQDTIEIAPYTSCVYRVKEGSK